MSMNYGSQPEVEYYLCWFVFASHGRLKNSCFDVLYSGLPIWTWWGKNVPKGKHSIAFCLLWLTNVCAKFAHLNNATPLN